MTHSILDCRNSQVTRRYHGAYVHDGAWLTYLNVVGSMLCNFKYALISPTLIASGFFDLVNTPT